MKIPRRIVALLLTVTVASSLARAQDGTPAPGKEVWNRAIYRLVKADGSSFAVKCLQPMRVARVESPDVIWFEVEGKGEARISDSDVERIRASRQAKKLPAGWSWVFESDPRTLHPDWDETFWKAMEDRTITHDMTPEMVRIIFGEPDKINVNKRPDDVQEHWVYSTGSMWFNDGKVFSWQAP